MTTIEVKTALFNVLNAASFAPVFEVGQVPKGQVFPYTVYKLGTSVEGLTDNVEAIQYPLELDVMDHTLDMDTTIAESLADAMDAALNRYRLDATTFYAYTVREGREPNAPTPDEFTIRRNLLYTLQVFPK